MAHNKVQHAIDLERNRIESWRIEGYSTPLPLGTPFENCTGRKSDQYMQDFGVLLREAFITFRDQLFGCFWGPSVEWYRA